jgi:hypothetical protein
MLLQLQQQVPLRHDKQRRQQQEMIPHSPLAKGLQQGQLAAHLCHNRRLDRCCRKLAVQGYYSRSQQRRWVLQCVRAQPPAGDHMLGRRTAGACLVVLGAAKVTLGTTVVVACD